MIAGVQFIGVLFALIMIYLSYVYYRRAAYSWRSFVLWAGVWLIFMTIIILPETFYGVMQALKIQRTADFLVMSGFLLYAIIIFYLYITVKKTNSKVESLVREMALNNVKKKSR